MDPHRCVHPDFPLSELLSPFPPNVSPEENHSDERLSEWVKLVPNICPDWRGLDTAAGIMWLTNAGLYQSVRLHVCVVSGRCASLRPPDRKTGRGRCVWACFSYSVTWFSVDTWMLEFLHPLRQCKEESEQESGKLTSVRKDEVSERESKRMKLIVWRK